MKKLFFFTTATVFALFILATAPLCEEMVEHHDNAVDNDGTADDCLFCHDGKTAKSAPVCTTPMCDVNAHKFLIKYPPPGRTKDFAPLETVQAAGIKLENGLITCITCHDLRNPLKYHFAIDGQPYAKKLCYVCHVDIG